MVFERKMQIINKFRLDERIVIITGGAGLLGVRHAEAVAEAGGIPILWDIDGEAARLKAREINKRNDINCLGMRVDVTDAENIRDASTTVLQDFKKIHCLINNAASDPKVSSSIGKTWERLENFSLEMWQTELAIGLTGAFLCSQVVGTIMANNGGGVILNIASDLGVIAPDHRIYRQDGLRDEEQPVKPVTYSVIKHGLIGLTKYLATYWAEKNVRVNALSPGGVYTNQSELFVQNLTRLIPMGRMAKPDEYKAAVLFLISDASSYMTGANLIVDGGRTCW